MSGFDLLFPREYLRSALVVSLLSVWVLVAIFYYLNRYTKRKYFTIWTAAWLFYALWLTLSITIPDPDLTSFAFVVTQWCVGVSALFLFWGSLQFLEIAVRQRLIGIAILFLLAWSFASPHYVNEKMWIQAPVFILIGMASMFVGYGFYSLRRRIRYVGAGLLAGGFSLWGIYLATYPFALEYEQLNTASFLVSAILQLFVAVSMIVLVLEEARHATEEMVAEIEAINEEKEALRLKILSVRDQGQLHTDLQRAYDELRRTQHSITQQERLRALGQMASGIAHDINNALSPVVAFSEIILKTEKQLTGNARRHLEHIRTAGEDIAQIVARMRDFYRRRSSIDPLAPVRLGTLLPQVIDMTRPRWRDIPQRQGVAIDVHADVPHDLPMLHANETELREAITNLILNSVDALPKGGTIRVIANARVPEGTETPEIALEVRDNGTGMDEQTRKQCLEPFFSTKGNRGGTGLGLAMVYGVMQRHGGRVEVDSEIGHGTTIRLIFPVQQAATNIVPLTKVTSNRQLRVLCIDDEPLLTELVKAVLELNHHSVTTADGGESGLAKFYEAKAAGTPFDLVITDLGMPHVDGSQVARRIKSDSPQTPVVMLTGWGALVREDGGSDTPVDAVLSKPPRVEELLATVGSLRAA